MRQKQSGVDIDLGNACSRIAYDWARKTFTNRGSGSGNPLTTVDGGFSNLMDFNGVKIGISSDGIGTKIELAERTGIYNTIGYDLVAMVADDLAANGIETVNLSNILDVDFLDAEIVDQLMHGLHDAANFAGITITGGEIAELGGRIAGYGKRMHFNWCATGIGILTQEKEVIDGRHIKSGDSVIALKSRGFRSNGFSLLRKIMQEKYGDDWHQAAYNIKKSWGEILLTPSLIYSPLITALREKDMPVHGIAHITGGGIGDNFSRALKAKNLGAELDDIFPAHDFMIKVQQLAALDEAQAYRLWNMGNGMLLVVESSAADEIIDFAFGKNYQARRCGVIIDEAQVIMQSKGNKPRQLTYTY